MPANKKYLIQNPWTKTSKIVAAIVGALFCTIAIHFVLALSLGIENVMLTSLYSIFMVWVALMLLVYWLKKAWLVWAMLLSILLCCSVLIYFLKKGMV